MDTRDLIITLITIAVVLGGIMGLCAYLIYVERKIAAYMQDRVGPNRVGPRGLLQPIADGLKFLFKEEIIPTHADRVLYLAAPAIAMSTALLAFAVVPFGPTTPAPADPGHDFVIAPHLDIGIVFVFAVTSLTVYGIILSGWSSNNKYSFLGGLRSSAQLVSYEIPMALDPAVLLAGSLNLERIIDQQAGTLWNVWYQPLGFVIFLTSAFAECNRLPFDLPEAEQELVGGYHTEYSAMKFAMFFLGEYTHMVTTSFLFVALFFGGWHLPWIAEPGPGGVVIKFIVLFAKVTFFILLYMAVRWTLPRFRFDQLMAIAWKGLIPLCLNLVTAMVIRELNTPVNWLLYPLVSLALLAGAGTMAFAAPRRALMAPGAVRPPV